MNFLHWPLLVVKRLNGHQGLVSIVYSIGQALAAGPNRKFNYFQLNGSVLSEDPSTNHLVSKVSSLKIKILIVSALRRGSLDIKGVYKPLLRECLSCRNCISKLYIRSRCRSINSLQNFSNSTRCMARNSCSCSAREINEEIFKYSHNWAVWLYTTKYTRRIFFVCLLVCGTGTGTRETSKEAIKGGCIGKWNSSNRFGVDDG